MNQSLIAAALVFALAACSPRDGDAGGTTQAGSADAAAAADASSAAAASGPEVLATADSENGQVRVERIARGLENPWALAFLPDGRMLVTERPGRMRIVDGDGNVSEPLAGVPEVYARNQGGLLDVVLAPDFADSARIYFSYSEPGEDGTGGTAVARATLGDGAIDDVEVIFRQDPKLDSGHHFGSRLVFADDGTLFITLGDRGMRPMAQDPSNHVGTLVRINPDGSVPEDNPFVGRDDARPEIWSYGHRNQQGAALHPGTRAIWTHEHGPMGGDEINIPQAGKNYGWPVITHGINYNGSPIPEAEGRAKEGMEQPHHVFEVSPGLSGMLFYTGDAHPAWQGDLFIGSLAKLALIRLELEGEAVVHEERLLTDLGRRIRDVRQGPDGAIYVLTDQSDGEVLRLSLAPSDG